MKVLIACEFSGIVRDAFIKQGHDATSCDLLPTERPGPHIQGDVLEMLDDGWDLMIAHPPCTYLCRNRGRLNEIENKQKEVHDSVEFFLKFLNAPIPKICIENPVMNQKAYDLIAEQRLFKQNQKYDQIIQPYQFGHDYSKKTCLWLKGLPLLRPAKVVELTYITTPNGTQYTKGWYQMPRKSKDRSRTFQGIADAMAEQWGYYE